MPRNHSPARRAQRKAEAVERAARYAAAGVSVAEREAARGFPARLAAKQGAEGARDGKH